ncbi:hypothetical protein BpHYR1_010171 [Brachionus plicatilis]|uniref:Uncharacterized protein n=1 Tax=Brachionus plicatilis TaxID=10195 RepID=A0A3M7PES6_BRAPC|nr:hypothetical protein BpHYR1_010171 [Brachionus plicatilis]
MLHKLYLIRYKKNSIRPKKVRTKLFLKKGKSICIRQPKTVGMENENEIHINHSNKKSQMFDCLNKNEEEESKKNKHLIYSSLDSHCVTLTKAISFACFK